MATRGLQKALRNSVMVVRRDPTHVAFRDITANSVKTCRLVKLSKWQLPCTWRRDAKRVGARVATYHVCMPLLVPFCYSDEGECADRDSGRGPAAPFVEIKKRNQER